MQGIRLVAALLAALVICGTGIAFAAQDDSESPPADPQLSSAPAQESPGVELTSKRTATSDTFRLPDGALETRLYESPVNYRDEEGDWKPIDEELEATGTGALVNGDNSFDLSLPSRMGAGPVRLSRGDQWVSYKLLGPETEPAELEGATASYETAGSGLGFDLSGLANGVKEEIELADPSQPSSFHFELDASSGLTPEILEDGSLEFRDEEEQVFATLPAPVISDSSPESLAPSDAVGYALQERPEGGWLLTLEVDQAWLSSPDRVWPARIDPTVTIGSPTLDCEIGGKKGQVGWGACGSGGNKELLAAYTPSLNSAEDEWARSLLRASASAQSPTTSTSAPRR